MAVAGVDMGSSFQQTSGFDQCTASGSSFGRDTGPAPEVVPVPCSMLAGYSSGLAR